MAYVNSLLIWCEFLANVPRNLKNEKKHHFEIFLFSDETELLIIGELCGKQIKSEPKL